MSKTKMESSCMADCSGRGCKCASSRYGVTQSLDEVDFNRGLGKAAVSGDVYRATLLISKGHDPDREDASGYVPLHYASRNGHARLCSLLLQNGSTVDRTTRSGQATSLHRAAYAGHEEVVKVLLNAGADPCIQDADGCTPLHKAVCQGHYKIADMLIRANSNVSSIRNNKGFLPHQDYKGII